MRCKVVIERRMENKVNAGSISQQVEQLKSRVTPANGWITNVRVHEGIQENNEGPWIYRATIVFKTTQERASLDAKFPVMMDKLRQIGQSGQFAKIPWLIVEPRELVSTREVSVSHETPTNENPVEMTPVNLTVTNQFERIYGRDPHIRLILDAIKLAVDTNYRKRIHSLLWGPPGCGKSEIMKCTQAVLGIEDEHFLSFDAPSTTRAGFQEHLFSADRVPPFIFIEEIEKTPPESLTPLLSILDHRAEIRRNNFRTGAQHRAIRSVVLATVNNITLFKSVYSGAIASRFQSQIYCPPPDRETMYQILIREISDLDNGDIEWAEPALLLAYDLLKKRDPREIISMCLLGRDRLFDGSFRQDVIDTMEIKEDATETE